MGINYNPDFNSGSQAGCGLYQVTMRNGRRSSAAVAYLGPARPRKNLTIKTNAKALNLIIESGRAVGVRYLEKNGRPTEARAGSEVVVSSGAIGSPHLLLLSGIGPADHLRSVGVPVVHDLPGVGQNLQDHFDMRTIRLSAPLDNQNPSEFSWWQKDLRNECAVSITPPLTGKKSADIAIIGGGFTGMWAALAIKRRDPTRTIMSLGRDDANPILRRDRQSTERAAAALARFLPAVASAGIDTTWGWPIEVSSDRLPFFGTLPGTQIHYGCGYTGHGVNATYIGGETLASLALQSKDEWSMSPFCTRKQPKLPPEPFRFFGGRFVQWGVLNCEDAEDVGKEGTWLGKFAASLPAKMGLRIGVR